MMNTTILGTDPFMEYIEMVLNYDDFISAFKKQVAIDLTLINSQGKVCKEFKLGQR